MGGRLSVLGGSGRSSDACTVRTSKTDATYTFSTTHEMLRLGAFYISRWRGSSIEKPPNIRGTPFAFCNSIPNTPRGAMGSSIV